MKKITIVKSIGIFAACVSMIIPSIPVSAADYEFRTGDDGKLYWYELGVKQGTVNDTQGILGDGSNRGREIFDPTTNGWYWLDSVYDGAKACGKEVWIPYIYQEELIMSADGNGRMANGISDEAKIKELAQASITSEADMSAQVEASIRNRTGKWVRYDENGVMLKGWVRIEGALAECYSDQAGNVYYYDKKTGLMAKGYITINGVMYHFDEISGALDNPEAVSDLKMNSSDNNRNTYGEGLTRNSEGYVVFGSYEQDGNISNGKEPIEWVVLDENENGTLLLSRYILDCAVYDEEWDGSDLFWETDVLRTWLNNDFFNSAFNDEEKARIRTTHVINGDTPYWGTDGGNDTYDRVFCLSIDEAIKYFNYNYFDEEEMYGYSQELIATVTPYAESNGVYIFTLTQEDYNGFLKAARYNSDCIGVRCASWRLRSTGYTSSITSYVQYFGTVNLYYCFSCSAGPLGVRPALYISK